MGQSLSPFGDATTWWRDLAFTSLFIQWVGLTSAAVLCGCRPLLRGLDNRMAGVIGYGLVLFVTVGLSEAAYRVVLHSALNIELQSAWEVGGAGYWFTQPQPVRVELSPDWHLEFLLRNLAISAIVAAVALRYLFVQHQWRSNLESEARARIQALQSRIRPHFLFNSMNTIASLTRSKPEMAEQITEDLAELFRASLADASIPATLEQELGICRQYLRIEQQRLGWRLASHWAVDTAPGDALLPRLTLQPLLENSVYHGIEPAADGGVVSVRAERTGARLRVRIANPVIERGARLARGGNRMAQDNVTQRLQAFFGEAASFQVVSAEREYAVELSFPYITELP